MASVFLEEVYALITDNARFWEVSSYLHCLVMTVTAITRQCGCCSAMDFALTLELRFAC